MRLNIKKLISINQTIISINRVAKYNCNINRFVSIIDEGALAAHKKLKIYPHWRDKNIITQPIVVYFYFSNHKLTSPSNK